jgi:hypothetical protein
MPDPNLVQDHTPMMQQYLRIIGKPVVGTDGYEASTGKVGRSFAGALCNMRRC